MAPNKINIKLWVDELESDRWIQVYGKPFGEKENEACATAVAFRLWHRAYGLLLNNYRNVKDFYGVNPALDTVKCRGEDRYVTALNDIEKLSFKEIARCIKDTYL